MGSGSEGTVNILHFQPKGKITKLRIITNNDSYAPFIDNYYTHPKQDVNRFLYTIIHNFRLYISYLTEKILIAITKNW